MKKGQTAWLVTWEWSGPHAAVEDRLAAILRPRLPQRIVGEIVECLYAIHAYSPSEIALWTKRPQQNPYKAQWHNGFCVCGHNPFLQAAYVHGLVIEKNLESGLETITWVYPPLYQLSKVTGLPEQVRGDLPGSTTRTITGPLSDREIGRFSMDASGDGDTS